MGALNTKMSALADEIRELSGTTTTKNIDTMASDVSAANIEVSSQADLITQISNALEGKAAGGTTLPDLNNPAGAGDILSGKEAIDENGNIVTGTIATKTSSNLIASGETVTVPAGYYPDSASKSVATATQAIPTVSVDSSGLITASATQTAGYVVAGTKSGTKQLTTEAAKIVTPSTSDQTAVASGRYTTGTVIVMGDGSLVPENIKSGESIFGVSGTYKGPNLQSKSVTYTSNGTATVTPDSGYGGLSSVNVTVNVSGGGGGGETPASAKWDDVTFIDYDGSVLYSYSLAEAHALTGLPALPSHEGLVCQGWNWTLEAIRALNRPVTVGAMYITDDGATKLHIRIETVGRMTVPLYIGQTVANGVSIDWGDGSTTQTLSRTGNVNTSHTYAEPGDYVISWLPHDGFTVSLGGGSC